MCPLYHEGSQTQDKIYCFLCLTNTPFYKEVFQKACHDAKGFHSVKRCWCYCQICDHWLSKNSSYHHCHSYCCQVGEGGWLLAFNMHRLLHQQADSLIRCWIKLSMMLSSLNRQLSTTEEYFMASTTWQGEKGLKKITFCLLLYCLVSKKLIKWFFSLIRQTKNDEIRKIYIYIYSNYF